MAASAGYVGSAGAIVGSQRGGGGGGSDVGIAGVLNHR